MIDTNKSTQYKNPYYSDIITYLLSRQQLLSQEFHQECVALFFLQNKLKIKLRTLYLAKQIYIKAQLFSNEYLSAALWIAIKYEQGEKISFDQYQRIVKLNNLTQLETKILNKIDFQLNQPTLIDFLELMIHSESIQHDQLVYALGLIVLPWNINYEPSIIAISLIVFIYSIYLDNFLQTSQSTIPIQFAIFVKSGNQRMLSLNQESYFSQQLLQSYCFIKVPHFHQIYQKELLPTLMTFQILYFIYSMIQPLFNPLSNNKSTQYSNIVTFNIHEIYVQDEFTSLSVLPPTVWQSDYYEQLLFELQYYGVTTNILDESDWQNMLETGQIDQNKNVLLSIFTRNSTISELFSLLVRLSPHTQQFHAIKEAYSQKNYETIYKDVKRTFKSSDFFKDKQIQDRMTNILIAYANLDTQLIYGQGMNFIVGGLMYLNIGTDEQIFDILRHIILDKEWRSLYIDGTPGLFLQTARFTYKLKKHLPKLHAHLTTLGLEDSSMCISHYYLTLFMQNAPIQFSLLILCMYFIEGEEILTKLLISMLHYFQNHILSLRDFQSATEFIRRGLLINFYREMQECRKKQRLIKMLIKCRFIKVKKPQQQQQLPNIIKRIITAPFKIGYGFLFQNQ